MSVSQRSLALLFGFWGCIAFAVQGQVRRQAEPISWQQNLPQVTPLQLEAVSAARLRAEDDERSRRVGNVVPPRYGQLQRLDVGTSNGGTWQTLPDSSRLWRASILTPGVLAQQLVFDQFDIPVGATLYCYSADRQQVRGPFTRDHAVNGQLSTLPIAGTEVVVEYHTPANVAGQGQLHINSSIGVFRAIPGVVDEGNAKAYGFGDSEACNLNINCPDGADWQNTKRSVALMLMNSYLCTGALVNNTAQDGRPLILSANHCYEAAISSGSTSTWLYVFNYESPSCDQNIEGPTNQTVTGSTLLARYQPSDVMLLELAQRPAESYNVHYAGWSRENGTPSRTVCIHHPRGDLKKISFDDQAASTATVSSFGTNAMWQVNWDRNTTTEVGSSGSPLFDANRRIVGQLYGGAAACSGTGNNGQPDYYGKFSVSWTGGGSNNNSLSRHLDPLGTGVTALNGVDADGTTDPIEPNEDSGKLLVFPNPARRTSVSVQLQTSATEPPSIQLVQPDGRVVYSGFLNRGNTDWYLQFNSANLSSGLYIVSVRQAGNDYAQRLIVTE